MVCVCVSVVMRPVSPRLLDLDSGEFDVSLDLESSNVVGVRAVSERSEALSVNEDLQGSTFLPL